MVVVGRPLKPLFFLLFNSSNVCGAVIVTETHAGRNEMFHRPRRMPMLLSIARCLNVMRFTYLINFAAALCWTVDSKEPFVCLLSVLRVLTSPFGFPFLLPLHKNSILFINVFRIPGICPTVSARIKEKYTRANTKETHKKKSGKEKKRWNWQTMCEDGRV